jgi:gliding motility-associated-like protein
LSWDAPDSCNADTKEYVLYFAPAGSNDFQEVAIIPSATTEYVYTNPISISGCYYIVSRDSNNNESSPSTSVCVETCPTYELPNVFTPDGDGVNDTYHPFLPFRDVRDVDMKIFNRWGALIFETTDPNIDWNGRKENTGEDLPEGVYFYICFVNEQRINTITSRELNGTISLYRVDKK